MLRLTKNQSGRRAPITWNGTFLERSLELWHLYAVQFGPDENSWTNNQIKAFKAELEEVDPNAVSDKESFDLKVLKRQMSNIDYCMFFAPVNVQSTAKSPASDLKTLFRNANDSAARRSWLSLRSVGKTDGPWWWSPKMEQELITYMCEYEHRRGNYMFRDLGHDWKIEYGDQWVKDYDPEATLEGMFLVLKLRKMIVYDWEKKKWYNTRTTDGAAAAQIYLADLQPLDLKKHGLDEGKTGEYIQPHKQEPQKEKENLFTIANDVRAIWRSWGS